MYQKEIRDYEAALKKKYASNIKSFFEKYGMDEGVGFDMLLFNARAFSKGAKSEIILGGGPVNVTELIADVRKLDDLKIRLAGASTR